MNFWLDIAAFAVKALVILTFFAALGGLIAFLSRKSGGGDEDEDDLKITSLNARYVDLETRMNEAIFDKKALKARAKEQKRAKKREPVEEGRKRVFVLTFKGDLHASPVARLAREVDAILSAARPGKDEVVVRIDSPGGLVTGYGLAAAQMLRLREGGLNLTASIDQVAASGGYMMACVAQKIVAAPFAIVGSIGVVAEFPNFNRLLKKLDVDYQEFTAGEFKRSVSPLGKITPAGAKHFRAKLEATHVAFKQFLAESRPKIDLEKVANGDVWLAREGLDLGLVDELASGEDYLFRARKEADLYSVDIAEHKTMLAQILGGIGLFAEKWGLAGPRRIF